MGHTMTWHRVFTLRHVTKEMYDSSPKIRNDLDRTIAREAELSAYRGGPRVGDLTREIVYDAKNRMLVCSVTAPTGER